jgi:hypothetical protein
MISIIGNPLRFFQSCGTPPQMPPQHPADPAGVRDNTPQVHTAFWRDKCTISYILLLTMIACAAIAWPKCNYDGVFYTALTYRTSDAKVLHDAGMQFYQRQPDDGVGPYREDMLQNPYHFKEQLPFYSVKPLYVFVLTLARRSGIGWRSGAFISGVCYLLLGWIVLLWLRKYYSSLATGTLASIMMLNPSLLQITRWTSPDIMAILATVAGTYVILENEMPIRGIMILAVGIWIRPETIIYTGLVVCAVYLNGRLRILGAVAFLALALGSYLYITRNGYSYSTLFYHTFIEELTAPAEVKVIVTKSTYLTVLKHSVQSLCQGNPTLCLSFLACAINYVIMPKQGLYALLSVLGIVSSIILYVAHPHFEPRYYLSQLVFIPVLVVLVQAGKMLNEPLVTGRRLETSGNPIALEVRHDINHVHGRVAN